MSIDPADGWTIPEGYRADNVGRCRGCGQRILWTITPSNKKAPLNPDGTSHFSNCPAADQFRTKANPIPKSRGGGSGSESGEIGPG